MSSSSWIIVDLGKAFDWMFEISLLLKGQNPIPVVLIPLYMLSFSLRSFTVKLVSMWGHLIVASPDAFNLIRVLAMVGSYLSPKRISLFLTPSPNSDARVLLSSAFNACPFSNEEKLTLGKCKSVSVSIFDPPTESLFNFGNILVAEESFPQATVVAVIPSKTFSSMDAPLLEAL